MKITIPVTSRLNGEIYLPASKSYSIRSFIIAACGGQSVLVRPSNCDDALVARRVAEQLGCFVKLSGRQMWKVYPKNRQKQRDWMKSRTIDVKESGTVLRFLLPLVTLHNQP